MEPRNEVRFAVSDRVNDTAVGPRHVPLSLLGEFQRDVSEFLRGSTKDVDPAEVMVSIEEGSLAIVASGLLAAHTLWADIGALSASKSLDTIDSKRSAVVARWQAAAQKNQHRKYAVADAQKMRFFAVDDHTSYVRGDEVWLPVEKYLSGRIVDWGGKKKANVHLELEGGGTLKIAASQEMLGEEERNRLYKSALLHVSVEENLLTGSIRNLNLLGFAESEPQFDEDEIAKMVSVGRDAWADVPDVTKWLEELRGGRL